MLTTNQIKSAAENKIEWCVENGDAPLFIGGVREGFEAGALWAENQLKPDIGLLRAENERLRQALTAVIDNVHDAAYAVNGGKVPAYWKSTLETAKKALEK